MSWRTVVISSRCKLDLKMGYMVIRTEETKRIFLDEINVLLLENSAISITGNLLNELISKKIDVIFCDNKRNPSSQLLPLYGAHDTSSKVRNQITWGKELKATIWTEIVAEKIRNQALLLDFVGENESSAMLLSYIEELEFNDATNREGHSAKVYFNALFGKSFTRSSDTAINAALNYGYSILLSIVNREIVACGYLTQFGLFHDNGFNHFNLGCDIMEPLRPLVDKKVISENFGIFESEEKHRVLTFLNEQVVIDENLQYVPNAIKYYCRSVFNAINENDPSLIKFISFLKDK